VSCYPALDVSYMQLAADVDERGVLLMSDFFYVGRLVAF
jgi:hypothetical protein